MEDIEAVAAAVAEAAAAAAMMDQQSPASPEIKSEIKQEPSVPSSPLKKSRTPPVDIENMEERAHKRLKTDDGGAGEIDPDELTRMIQQAQESATSQPLDDYPMMDFHGAVNGDTNGPTNGSAHDPTDDIVNSIMQSLDQGMANDVDGILNGENQDMDLLKDSVLPSEPQDATYISTRNTLWGNPVGFTRENHVLPSLGKAAVDIIKVLSEQSLEDTITTINEPESEVSREYAQLKSFFDLIRKTFSDDSPLLDPDQLGITRATDREVIRISNLATTCASMFGTNELGWEEMNNNFLAIFVPRGQTMSKEVAELFLGHKSQWYFAVLESDPEVDREQFLESVFGAGVENLLKSHHPDVAVTDAETAFITECLTRKLTLRIESGDETSMQGLLQKFTYEAYLDGLSTYLNDNIDTIEGLGIGQINPDAPFDNSVKEGLVPEFDIDTAIAEATKAAQGAIDAAAPGHDNSMDELEAFIRQATKEATEVSATNSEIPSALMSESDSAARATRLALESIQQTQWQPTMPPQTTAQPTPPVPAPAAITPQQQQQHLQQQQLAANQNQFQSITRGQLQHYPQPHSHPQQQMVGNMQPQSSFQKGELPPNQTAPTCALYEAARRVAASRTSTHARREGSQSTRRPWTPQEEQALMVGLDMCKGPHWSQILSLFGPNGTLSQVLADRTQVQLKDKARNLKLFFLKTNCEMPYYLQGVTGELRTRAPSQAARKEAEERTRKDSEEEKARINGVATLSNMQQANGAGAAQGQRPSMPMMPQQRSVVPKQPHQHQHQHPHPHAGSMSQIQTPRTMPAPAKPIFPAAQPVVLPPSVARAQSISQPHSQSHPQIQPQAQHGAPVKIQPHPQQTNNQLQQPRLQSQPQPQPSLLPHGHPQPQTHTQHQQPIQPQPPAQSVKPQFQQQAGQQPQQLQPQRQTQPQLQPRPPQQDAQPAVIKTEPPPVELKQEPQHSDEEAALLALLSADAAASAAMGDLVAAVAPMET